MLHSIHKRGFTIIEVLVVMAIAGLILVVVFLAVPAAKRVQRDTERRQAVNLLYSEVQEYMRENGITPDTAAGFCNAIAATSLGKQSTTPCAASFVSVGPGSQCVRVEGDVYSICYHDRTSAHEYFGTPDEINIQHAHWCAEDKSDPTNYPITDNHTNNTMMANFVVWTQLENGDVACVGSA